VEACEKEHGTGTIERPAASRDYGNDNFENYKGGDENKEARRVHAVRWCLPSVEPSVHRAFAHVVRLTAKLTDRRWKRALAANPASDKPRRSKGEMLGGGSCGAFFVRRQRFHALYDKNASQCGHIQISRRP
jgi:hypothetical protein